MSFGKRQFLVFSLCMVSCVSTVSEISVRSFVPVEEGRDPRSFRAVGQKGMVVAAHPAATKAGQEMLAAGGNAADAVVAASFVISVVRPQSTGLGGGGFLLHARPKDSLRSDPTTAPEIRVFDFRERAPLAADRNMFVTGTKPRQVFFRGREVPSPAMNGHLSVAVPGTVKGLIEYHEKYGKLPRQKVLEPAIRLAREGFVVYPTLADALSKREAVLRLYPSSAAVFFKEGRPLRLGEILVQKDLAVTLEKIASDGWHDFYQGGIAAKIIAEIQDGQGIMQKKDLDDYRVIERQALSTVYRGYSVVTMPPPSSGGVHLIQMLNMLEYDDIKALGYNTGAYPHLLAEVMRRAYADRARYMGDTDFVSVPVRQLIDKQYAKELRLSISADKAKPSMEINNPHLPSSESQSTTHISVVDADGFAVSTTQTINYLFGSGVVASGTGVLLNDEMDDFAANPGKPNAFGLMQSEANAVAPRKTPLSSMTPTILLQADGSVFLIVGSPGGPRIINAVLQTILNVVDFKLPLLDAVHATRIHHQWLPDRIEFEATGLTDEQQQFLKQRGHHLRPLDVSGRVPDAVGQIAAIVRDGKDWIGVADTRAEGLAAGF